MDNNLENEIEFYKTAYKHLKKNPCWDEREQLAKEFLFETISMYDVLKIELKNNAYFIARNEDDVIGRDALDAEPRYQEIHSALCSLDKINEQLQKIKNHDTLRDLIDFFSERLKQHSSLGKESAELPSWIEEAIENVKQRYTDKE